MTERCKLEASYVLLSSSVHESRLLYKSLNTLYHQEGRVPNTRVEIYEGQYSLIPSFDQQNDKQTLGLGIFAGAITALLYKCGPVLTRVALSKVRFRLETSPLHLCKSNTEIHLQAHW